MENDTKDRKKILREEAVRARGLLSLSQSEITEFNHLFFKNIPLAQGIIIAGYWPKDREFDVRPLMDELLLKDIKIALPIIADNMNKVLRFARWRENTILVEGKYGIAHPIIESHTEFLEPDIFLVPMLAFDRRGTRLGFGGGYYDATLNKYRKQKKIIAVGVAYAQQACLFKLPSENHDEQMDWIITQQQAFSY